jgi:3-oxoacyl-[acyl-carrier-protein] synthase-3
VEKRSAYIKAVGMYLPDKVVTNDDLAKVMDTNDEWIVQRTGIHERHYADVGVATSDLAVKATQNLLDKGDVRAEEIDCIILATLSPDQMFPGTGMFLQDKLGWSERCIPCYDIRQQCSGFVYGMQMAQAFVETGMYDNVLLVGAEVHSHGLDFSDRGRSITVLFGDGAAAVVVSPSDSEQSRILHSEVYADGTGALNGVHTKLFDISKQPVIDYDPTNFETNADMFPAMPAPKNLFVNAVTRMSEVVLSSLDRVGLSVADVDWVLPHQANMRINSMMAHNVDIPDEKVLYNIHKFGNTTAATIPLLLAEFVDNGTIKRGDLLLMVAFGAGFTWGSIVLRY